jgi:pSer/pThr/pTyr-binding forkhead associated (FHA) protein
MQAVLVMFRSDGDRRSFSLTRDITVIGRREDCDLRIPLGEVSRKHCRLVRDGDSLRLEDLGSSNGTYHNSQRVQEAILSPGDSIQVGPLVFVLQIDGVPPDDELAPVVAQSGEAHETGPSAEKGPLQPTAQSDVGMGELPSLDDLEPIESLEEEPLQADALTEDEALESASLLDDEAPPAAEPLETTQPLGLDHPLEELTFDELHGNEAGAHNAAAGHDDDALGLDDLDVEQEALELDDEHEHHAPVQGEHETPRH